MRQGHICVPGASSEGGLVSVGDMHGKCDVVRLYESYSSDWRTRPGTSDVMRCRERIQNCVSLSPADFGTFVRSGAGSYCLQDVLRSCMRAKPISEAGFEQYIESWAAEFDAGIDSGKALEYRWSRDREYILRTSYPRGMRTCGEGNFGESEDLEGVVPNVNGTGAVLELRTKHALLLQELAGVLRESDASDTEALRQEIANTKIRHEDEMLNFINLYIRRVRSQGHRVTR
jgi:hypothetical protein